MMTFKLWHKLALTIISITSIILILALFLSQQSVKSGFLEYINGIEARKLQRLSNRLINDYEFYNDWEFIKENRRLWGRYLHEAKPNPPRRRRPEGDHPPPRPPHLQGFAKRFSTEDAPPPPRREEGRGRGDLERRDAPPKRHRRLRPDPPPINISLLDQDNKKVIGFGAHRKDAINKPLILEGVTIGYLRIDPFTRIVGELDQQFIAHQKQAFIKIALIALLLIMIGAWGLAFYLRRRIDQLGVHARQLTKGQYSVKIEHSSADELGQLADNLNYLGRTLHENRQSRQQWIADISHELRTPLAILCGQVEALEDGIRPFDHKAIKLLGREVNRLGKLVDDLFQLSLSDLGALSYHKERLTINPLVEGVMEHFHQRLATKALDVDLSLTACSNLNILGDPQRLRQALINIVENAIRYTDAGGVIKISCYQQDRSIRLSIEDSTPSVSPDQLNKLFQCLYRGERSRNRSTGGAGLGLAIVQSIVNAHEGSITAKISTLGGLLLELRFPIAPTKT
jgi:two-component system sensor histidine kinase BaeS